MFFGAYLAVPIAELPYLPFSGTSHLSFSVVTVSRLLFLNDSDWDLQLARKDVDLCDIARRLGERFGKADQCAAAGGWRRKRKFVDEGRPTMVASGDKIRWIGSWYLSKLLPVKDSHQPQRQGTTTAPGDAELLDVDLFDMGILSPSQFDPTYWEALLNEDFGGVGDL